MITYTLEEVRLDPEKAHATLQMLIAEVEDLHKRLDRYAKLLEKSSVLLTNYQALSDSLLNIVNPDGAFT